VLQFGLARSAIWIVATSSMVMFLPYIIERERSDMEKNQVIARFALGIANRGLLHDHANREKYQGLWSFSPCPFFHYEVNRPSPLPGWSVLQ
jgi:hypothetical protein